MGFLKMKVCEDSFIATAKQIGKKYPDGSGETGLWTDGLCVSIMDHRQDNLSGIKFKAGDEYKVTVILEKVE